MPLIYVSGDPMLTRAQIIAFGHNVRGRPESDDLQTRLQQQYPAAFATYARRCHKGLIKTGMLWMWRDSAPALGFMVVRASPFGATRLRYVEAITLMLARDYKLEGIKSVALVAPGSPWEWTALKEVIERWLGNIALPIVVYEQVIAGVTADESAVLPLKE